MLSPYLLQGILKEKSSDKNPIELEINLSYGLSPELRQGNCFNRKDILILNCLKIPF